MNSQGLCNRCEYRAQFIERGHGPRFECSRVGQAVCSCYMYKPVNPVVLQRRAGDKRPCCGGILGARMEAVKVFEDTVPVRVDLNKRRTRFALLLVQKETEQDG